MKRHKNSGKTANVDRKKRNQESNRLSYATLADLSATYTLSLIDEAFEIRLRDAQVRFSILAFNCYCVGVVILCLRTQKIDNAMHDAPFPVLLAPVRLSNDDGTRCFRCCRLSLVIFFLL